MDDAVAWLRDNLKGVKRARGEWSALCPVPAHEDKRASLTFGPGKKHGLVVHCFAGCSFDEIVHACGLPAQMRRKVVEIEHTYTYRDRDGEPYRQVLRLPGKRWLQRSWDAGEIVWSVTGLQNVLYDLPDVIEAARLGATIWVTEGERDAETLKRHSLVATTAPGGAMNVKAWTAELVAPLRGASRVVILADCDSVGRNAAWDRRRVIGEVVGNVSVVDLDPTRDDGFDVSNFFGNGGTLEGLLAKADDAPSSRPPFAEVYHASEHDESAKSATYLRHYDAVSERRDLTRCDKTVYSYIRRDFELSQDLKRRKGFRFDLSTRAIAKKTGMARSSVNAAIKRLESLGLIIVHGSNGGRGQTNSYGIVISPTHTVRKSDHLAEVSESTNGPIFGPQTVRFSDTHIYRVAETLNTQKENSSTNSDLETQPAAKNSAKNGEAVKLSCGHALPWIDENGERHCMACNPPSNLRVIPPTAEAIKAFKTSVSTGEWPWK